MRRLHEESFTLLHATCGYEILEDTLGNIVFGESGLLELRPVGGGAAQEAGGPGAATQREKSVEAVGDHGATDGALGTTDGSQATNVGGDQAARGGEEETAPLLGCTTQKPPASSSSHNHSGSSGRRELPFLPLLARKPEHLSFSVGADEKPKNGFPSSTTTATAVSAQSQSFQHTSAEAVDNIAALSRGGRGGRGGPTALGKQQISSFSAEHDAPRSHEGGRLLEAARRQRRGDRPTGFCSFRQEVPRRSSGLPTATTEEFRRGGPSFQGGGRCNVPAAVFNGAPVFSEEEEEEPMFLYGSGRCFALKVQVAKSARHFEVGRRI